MSLAPVASQTLGQGTAMASWAPAPATPQLQSGAVHVWRVDLEVVDDRFDGLLARDERRRAARIISPRRRRLWSHSRGVLRALLASYMRCDPPTVRLQSLAGGKPILEKPSGSVRALSFNLSHSEGLALYAFAGAQIGVDVQLARAPSRGTIDQVALARRIFGEEARHLSTLGAEERERAFLRLWVRHEAELKQRGRGIWDCPIQIEHRPWIAELDVGANAAAAVACARPPGELMLWTWVSRDQ